MAEIGKTSAGNEAHVAGTDDRNAHETSHETSINPYSIPDQGDDTALLAKFGGKTARAIAALA